MITREDPKLSLREELLHTMVPEWDNNGPEKMGIIWQGKPHLRQALLTELTFASISYWIVDVLLSAYRARQGSPIPISFSVQAFPVVVALGAAFSLRVLRCEYMVTKRAIYVRKGKKWTHYPLSRIRTIKAKNIIKVSDFLGTNLDIYLKPSGSAERSSPGLINLENHITFEYIEAPFQVKEIIETWMNHANPS